MDKALKGTVVNQALLSLHGMCHECSLTVPLKRVFAKNKMGYRLNAIKKRF